MFCPQTLGSLCRVQEQLASRLADHGLPRSGTKPQLIQRLLAAGPLPPLPLAAPPLGGVAGADQAAASAAKAGTLKRKGGGTAVKKAAQVAASAVGSTATVRKRGGTA